MTTTTDRLHYTAGTATRVSAADARAHFHAGGSVLVSDRGWEPTCTYGPLTVMHNRDTTTWDALAGTVTAWGDRNQRYYTVPLPACAGCGNTRTAIDACKARIPGADVYCCLADLDDGTCPDCDDGPGLGMCICHLV